MSNDRDYDAVTASRTPDFIIQLLPRSLNLQSLDNEGYKALWLGFLVPSFMDSFKVTFSSSRRRESAAPVSCPSKIDGVAC